MFLNSFFFKPTHFLKDQKPGTTRKCEKEKEKNC